LAAHIVGRQLERIAVDVTGALLKIAADLKRRVVAAAKAADKSPHAFLLEAVEHQTRRANSAARLSLRYR
jgi:hypothetical protein